MIDAARDADGPALELQPNDWKRWLPWLPSAFLVLVALLQITLSFTADLDPWKGGGFGMFSTLDRIASRQLRASMLADSRWVPLRIPRAYILDVRRTVSMPTDTALDHFAELLVAKAAHRSIYARYGSMSSG